MKFQCIAHRHSPTCVWEGGRGAHLNLVVSLCVGIGSSICTRARAGMLPRIRACLRVGVGAILKIVLRFFHDVGYPRRHACGSTGQNVWQRKPLPVGLMLGRGSTVGLPLIASVVLVSRFELAKKAEQLLTVRSEQGIASNNFLLEN